MRKYPDDVVSRRANLSIRMAKDQNKQLIRVYRVWYLIKDIQKSGGEIYVHDKKMGTRERLPKIWTLKN